MIDQRKRMRPWLIGANHQGFKPLLSSSGCRDAQFFFDKILCAESKSKCREQEKQQEEKQGP